MAAYGLIPNKPYDLVWGNVGHGVKTLTDFEKKKSRIKKKKRGPKKRG